MLGYGIAWPQNRRKEAGAVKDRQRHHLFWVREEMLSNAELRVTLPRDYNGGVQQMQKMLWAHLAFQIALRHPGNVLQTLVSTINKLALARSSVSR